MRFRPPWCRAAATAGGDRGGVSPGPDGAERTGAPRRETGRDPSALHHTESCQRPTPLGRPGEARGPPHGERWPSVHRALIARPSRRGERRLSARAATIACAPRHGVAPNPERDLGSGSKQSTPRHESPPGPEPLRG